MKTQRLLFLAGLALASLSALSARDTTPAEKGDYEGWFNYYYKHPQPEYLLKATYQLNRQGFFDDGQSSVAMGFYATIFAQNPGKVDEWFANFRAMPMNVQRLMASALYLSGDRRGPQYLTRVANLAAPDSRTRIRELAQTPSPGVAATPIASVSSMSLAWGSFLATGQDAPVVKILAALGSTPTDSSINEAARWSLAVNGASHDRVLEICSEQLNRQPNEVRTILKAVINEAQTNKHGSS
ncbi:MAG TPA: hypothetical protein VKC60_00735 [Opitutaceae bacterium]|nr:hypothetical protein [Opitutaceae bacterium]